MARNVDLDFILLRAKQSVLEVQLFQSEAKVMWRCQHLGALGTHKEEIKTVSLKDSAWERLIISSKEGDNTKKKKEISALEKEVWGAVLQSFTWEIRSLRRTSKHVEAGILALAQYKYMFIHVSCVSLACRISTQGCVLYL